MSSAVALRFDDSTPVELPGRFDKWREYWESLSDFMKQLACVLGLMAAVAFAAPDVVARVRDGETKLPLVGAMVISEGSDIMAVTDSAGRCVVAVAPRRGGALAACPCSLPETLRNIVL